MKRPDLIFFNGKIIWLLLLVVLALVLVACGGDKEKTSGGSEEETQGIAIEDKTVAGVTQKGPFINGSSVTLFELNGTNLLQTGNSFVGRIKSDKGDFSISGINLVSPYALLEAKGYYRNEVSGKKSVSEITLNAVTNLENRDNVNVNLLTHLEYERVQGLVKKNVDIASAKEQAEKEIFTSFYVDEDVENFEDLNIFKTGEDDAVLLAISVLMQGERSEAELSELLANYSYDVESDGIWNNEEAKAEIADWAEMQTLSTGLENIRKNIEDWKFGTAPGFEKYVMRFWWYNYGLGLCDAKNEGSIKKNENKLSTNVGIRYICRNNFWYRYGEQSSSSEAVTSSSSNELEITSSSSEIITSSSSNEPVISSSSNINNSSSSENFESSSSSEVASSSSVVAESSSSEVSEISSSSLSISKQNWQYLNPEKEYGEFIDSRDNQTYKTIEICDSEKKICQTWMAENLNYAIEQGSQNAYDTKSVCGGFSLNQQGDCDTYGRLYAWDIAMEACPTEWHLPSLDEFQKLLDLVSESSTTAGAKLNTNSNLWSGAASDNSSGFSALPAGNRFFGAGTITYFWSSTDDDVYKSYMMQIDSYNATLVRTEKGHLNSVRCVKDSD